MTDEQEPDEQAENTGDVSRNSGCLIKSFVFGVVLIAGVIWIMGRWNDLPAASKAGAIVLVVIGTVACIPQLLIWVFKLWLRRVFRQVGQELSSVSKNIVEM